MAVAPCRMASRKTLARVGERAGGRAGGDLDLLQEPVLAVQAEHPEFFDGQSGNLRFEMGVNELGAVEHLVLRLGTLRQAAGARFP
jgi:hypothetical protein